MDSALVSHERLLYVSEDIQHEHFILFLTLFSLKVR